jgi:hypothetical protein
MINKETYKTQQQLAVENYNRGYSDAMQKVKEEWDKLKNNIRFDDVDCDCKFCEDMRKSISDFKKELSLEDKGEEK